MKNKIKWSTRADNLVYKIRFQVLPTQIRETEKALRKAFNDGAKYGKENITVLDLLKQGYKINIVPMTTEDRIEEWHKTDTTKTLPEWLGWTEEEYKRWIETW